MVIPGAPWKVSGVRQACPTGRMRTADSIAHQRAAAEMAPADLRLPATARPGVFGAVSPPPPTWNGGVGHGVSRNLFCTRWCSTAPFFSFTSSVSTHAEPLSKAVPCFLTSDPQKLWTMAGGLPSDSSVDGYQSHPCDSFSPRTLPPPASAFGGPSSVPSTHISLFYPKFIVALSVRFYLSPANTPSLVS